MYISPEDTERIKTAADGKLVDVVSEFISLTKAKTGSTYTGECPICGEAKGLSISDSKQAFNCFKCQNIKGHGALSFLMKGKDKSYTEALEFLATRFNVILHEEPEKIKKKVIPSTKKQSKQNRGEDPNSFCFKMLAESGLSPEDVTASVYKVGDNKSIFKLRTIRPGTINAKGEIVAGDDAIIEYYDLDGMPVMYQLKDAKGRLTDNKKEYYRVRWQYPSEHLDKTGKPYKYKSPIGGGTPIYIPERLRSLYKDQTPIERLYIQEGEKKAEKACKHGIPSVAISGIQNLGNNGTLPEDLIRIIETCQVKEVVFIMDSDWNDISSNIKINDNVQQRPLNFFYAVRNYRDYMRSLKNRNIYVEIYAGHINKNDAHDKGLDDLLANTLSGKEDELLKDIEFLINEKNLTGKYAQLFKITTCTEHKLQELWSLQSPQKFAELHRDVLINLPEFRIGRHRWKFDENGALESAQPIESDEQFWEEIEKCRKNGDVYKEYDFKYVRSRRFLQNRGFGRFKRLDDTYQFIRLDPPIVSVIEASDARDFLFEFTEANCNEAVNEMLSKGVSQYVGPDKLSLLKFIEPNFLKSSRDIQYFYFRNTCWEISANEVKELDYANIRHHIWADQHKNFPAKHLQVPMVKFTQDSQGNYNYSFSELGKKCHYLQFLTNASNFTWRKEQARSRGEKVEISDQELQENKVHLLSKLCAIGYMLMECKDANVSKAVIGMDGKQSEVGESNGRSGKSLVGELFRAVSTIAYLNGKKRDMFNDVFLWNDVVEKTKIVFIDDVLQGFRFEDLFPNITGDWSVNYKGGRRVTFPFTMSPKLYIATNHSINGSGTSFSDRQWLLAFSDYYNGAHKPADDFGCLFFSEWDYDQWNLCWNLLADCVQLYLKYGVVEAPGERLESRQLRQEITEGFIAWADEYFSSAENRNKKIPRKTLSDAYFEYDPLQRKYVTPPEFKKRFIKFCKWKGYAFNPNKYDPITGKPNTLDKDGRPIIDDKSGGIEFFTVGDGTAFLDPDQQKLSFEES